MDRLHEPASLRFGSQVVTPQSHKFADAHGNKFTYRLAATQVVGGELIFLQ